MYRIAIEKLYRWKESKRRKPLIIEGARQVGKTTMLKHLAESGRSYVTMDNAMAFLKGEKSGTELN